VTVSSSRESSITSALERLRKDYPDSKINGYTCDLSTPSIEANIENLFSQAGKVDHIVITAGDGLATMPLQEITLEKIQRAGQVRFIGPLLIAKVGSRYLTPGLESSIILTTGSIAESPRPDWSVIASYASGLHGMTRNLALDLKPVRVNLVSPGPVDTEMWKDVPAAEKENLFKAMAAKTLTGRVGRPEDVAESYIYLMKDSNITGSVVASDSGVKLI
jgi:NAD(P)-dependent dehydrogenase (short-subunit alcohol dehydrogenase family)